MSTLEHLQSAINLNVEVMLPKTLLYIVLDNRIFLLLQDFHIYKVETK